MHAYLLALEIEPVDSNKVYVALPLHLTMMSWFYSDEPPAEIVRCLQSVVDQQQPIELTSAAPDLFGEEKDVPVNRLADETVLKQFHQTLRTTLEPLGITFKSPEWVGDGFTPHVTRQQSGRFEEGRKHLATKLYIVEAVEPDLLQQKRIIQKLTLGNA